MATVLASASLQISTASSLYVEAGYIESGYFPSGEIIGTKLKEISPSLAIASEVGSQNYVAADYIEAGYFAATIDATLIPLSVTIPITASMATDADDTDEAEVSIAIAATASIAAGSILPGTANLSIETNIGDGYTEAGYITVDYFEHTITATDSDETGAVDLSSTASLSADANATQIAEVSASISSAFSAVEAGSIQPATASLSSTASVSVAAVEIVAGTVAASIAASTSITANATVETGDITADISSSTSIEVNATNTGEILISSTGAMTINGSIIVPPIYSVKVPTRSRVNSISEQTRSISIPKRTRELEFY